jgi:osmotically-inducible protein OsmY
VRGDGNPNARLENHDRRLDDQLRGAELQALIWDSEVPSDGIDVKVAHGWVTLAGDLDYQFQSDAAFNDIVSPRGGCWAHERDQGCQPGPVDSAEYQGDRRHPVGSRPFRCRNRRLWPGGEVLSDAGTVGARIP